MSGLRIEIWHKKIGTKNITSAPSLKTLPCTTEVFKEHIKRCQLQCIIWKSALLPDPPALDITKYGWKIENDTKYDPVMFPDGTNAVPHDLLNLVKCGCSNQQPCGTKRCSCNTAGLSCSPFCNCKGDELCLNPQTRHFNNEAQDSDDPGRLKFYLWGRINLKYILMHEILFYKSFINIIT